MQPTELVEKIVAGQSLLDFPLPECSELEDVRPTKGNLMLDEAGAAMAAGDEDAGTLDVRWPLLPSVGSWLLPLPQHRKHLVDSVVSSSVTSAPVEPKMAPDSARVPVRVCVRGGA